MLVPGQGSFVVVVGDGGCIPRALGGPVDPEDDTHSSFLPQSRRRIVSSISLPRPGAESRLGDPKVSLPRRFRGVSGAVGYARKSSVPRQLAGCAEGRGSSLAPVFRNDARASP
jgi:hypothetical protein